MMTTDRMPMIFAGHGSPMSAIENNTFTAAWETIGKELPRPKAILAISAHWFGSGLRVQPQEQPQQIYDMYGFPQALYDLKYTAKGNPALAETVLNMIQSRSVQPDDTWGIDHGTWAVLCKMYPHADIPIVQLSIDLDATPKELYQIGQELQPLRDQGILIFASGDVVHNLRLLDWNREDGFDWADAFDQYIRDRILSHDDDAVINFMDFGDPARLSCPTPEHFYPLLYVLGASTQDDHIRVSNDARTMGSLSLTGFIWE
jgi:4,5-DOPA dioxygenase extradiol